MTRTALEKLNETQLTFCKRLSLLIDMCRDRKDEYGKETFNYRIGNLKGYLFGLIDADIITQSDARVLYAYFKQKNRNEEETK